MYFVQSLRLFNVKIIQGDKPFCERKKETKEYQTPFTVERFTSSANGSGKAWEAYLRWWSEDGAATAVSAIADEDVASATTVMSDDDDAAAATISASTLIVVISFLLILLQMLMSLLLLTYLCCWDWRFLTSHYFTPTGPKYYLLRKSLTIFF